MADDEHVAMLKKGVAAWNAWRGANADIRPDLKEANLSGADLSGSNLSEADLSETDLWRTNLSKAILSEADLRGRTSGGRSSARRCQRQPGVLSRRAVLREPCAS